MGGAAVQKPGRGRACGPPCRIARIEAIDDEVRSITETITEAVRATSTRLVEIPGVGAVTAAKILGEAGDVREPPLPFRRSSSYIGECGIRGWA